MKKIILPVLTVLMLTVSAFSFVAPVSAQVRTGENIGVCSFIGPICDALGLNTGNAGQTATSIVRNWVNLGITLLFIGIILISVFIIIQAAIKYIQSQGDEGKIAEAQKAIKSVFVGIALLFVGIVGMVLVLAFFGGTGLLNGGNDTCSQCVLNCTLRGDKSNIECQTECSPQCQGTGSGGNGITNSAR